MNRHKPFPYFAAAILGAWMTLEPLSAFGADAINLRFTCERKRFDVEEGTKKLQAIKEEEWGYTVRVENTSFKDLQGLRIDYLVFGEQEIAGSSASRDLCTKGSVDLAEFVKNQKYSFVTESLKTTSSQLDSDWRYANGASTRSRGRMVGIWIKVFQDGKVVSEYANPTSLKSKNWDNPVPAPKAPK